MPYRINCELCGRWIDAERRSRQYCGPCRPRAVVLNNVVKALNLAAEVSPVVIDELIEQRVEVDYHDPLRGISVLLNGVEPLGPLTFLNIALKDYGMIAWDGSRFEIVPWRDRPGVELEADPAGTLV